MWLGLWLHSVESTSFVIQFLNLTGPICEYDQFLTAVKEVSNVSKKMITSIGNQARSVFISDNVDQQLGFDHQRLKSQRQNMSKTSGYITEGANMSSDGVDESMDRKRKPFTTRPDYVPMVLTTKR